MAMKKIQKAKNQKGILKIIEHPNPILRGRTLKIKKIDLNISKLIKGMVKTMFEAKGIGLAAPQVGKSLRLAVLEYSPKRFGEKNVPENAGVPLMALLNPKITYYSKETDTFDEGCLSLPGLEVPVQRAKEIHVLAQDLEGNRIRIRAKGLLARILQHEIDHLEGKMIIDRAEKNSKLKTKSAK